jgi:hypothetical protein
MGSLLSEHRLNPRARTFLGPSTTIATGKVSRDISIAVTISQQKISTSLVAELDSVNSSAAPLPWARPTAGTSLTNLGQKIVIRVLDHGNTIHLNVPNLD